MSANQAPEKTAAERKAAWEDIRKELPREKTPAEKKRRLALFKKFDKDGSKSLTLEETYQGCIDILHLERFTPRLKDITKRAFAKASGLGTQIDGVGDESEVEFLEFRMMLCYIYDYFELTVMFDEIDTSGNMMLDKDEFKEAVPKLAEWGVRINDPDATFAEIDGNGSGQVTFDEFAAWAAAKKLDADGDPDNIGAPLPTSVKDNAPEEAKSRSAPPVKSRSAPVPSGLPVIVKKHPGASTEEPIQSRAAVVDNGAAERLAAWEDIRKELPREKTPEDKKRRIELFEKFDKDGSKSLTLEETYQGCIDILHLERFTPRLKDITKRAFAKASGLGTQIDGVGEEDKVEFLEFRMMLCYIYDYFELTVMFDEIDTSGNMILDKEEFNQAVPRIAEWGVTIEDPDATFAEIDGNGSGQVTFDEFAAWAAAKKLDADGDPDNIGAPLPTSVNNAEEQPKARSLPEDKSAAERKTAWEEIRKELPRKKTPEDKKRRIELFKKFDKDGSKSLTLEETYQGCIDILHLDRFTSRLKDITKRAFAKASGLGTSIDGVGDESEVEFLEFRMMLCYIYDYFELTVMFDEIDTSGNMMLDKDEFKEAVPRIAEWGVQISDPDATFAEIDDNGSGQVTFDEFAAWATAKKLDADGDPDNIGAAAPTSVKKGGSKKK